MVGEGCEGCEAFFIKYSSKNNKKSLWKRVKSLHTLHRPHHPVQYRKSGGEQLSLRLFKKLCVHSKFYGFLLFHTLNAQQKNNCCLTLSLINPYKRHRRILKPMAAIQ